MENLEAGFECPITLEIMTDPVTLVASGQSYERHALEAWLRNHGTDPLTGASISSKALVPNVALRRQILEWRNLQKLHEEEDKKRKEKVEVRNNADALVHNTEKTMEELKDKFSEDDKKNIEKALKELRESLTGDDIGTIKQKTDALTQVLEKASTAIYQQAAQQQQQQAAGSNNTDESWQGKPSDDDKTIDADYKVKGDEKKDDNKD